MNQIIQQAQSAHPIFARNKNWPSLFAEKERLEKPDQNYLERVCRVS
jgi:hypothetical protein